MITSKRNSVIFQVLCSLLFLTQPVWLSTSPPGEHNFLFSRPTLRDFMANGLMLSFFYLHFYVLIPGLYFKKRYVVYAISLVSAIALICFLPSLLTGRNPFEPANTTVTSSQPPAPRRQPTEAYRDHQQPPPGPGLAHEPDMPPHQPIVHDTGAVPAGSTFYEEIKHHVFLLVAVIFFSLLLRIRSRLFEAETARHQAELANLKAQINPHFLFNTLNSIYALAVKKDDKTADAIINLSELMRYILRDGKDNRIPLQKELDYVQNYIDLQSARLGHTVDIRFSTIEEAAAGRKEIAPLILISFIENAFKYGVNPDLKSIVTIHITEKENSLHLTVGNRKVATRKDVLSSGIGLDNTIERLRLLYPGKHQLDITENDTEYLVNLTIQLA